jgi:hypothetical protein
MVATGVIGTLALFLITMQDDDFLRYDPDPAPVAETAPQQLVRLSENRRRLCSKLYKEGRSFDEVRTTARTQSGLYGDPNDAIEACLTYQRAIIDQAAAALDKAADEIRREASKRQ